MVSFPGGTNFTGRRATFRLARPMLDEGSSSYQTKWTQWKFDSLLSAITEASFNHKAETMCTLPCCAQCYSESEVKLSFIYRAFQQSASGSL
jgi:hypothetical protein